MSEDGTVRDSKMTDRLDWNSRDGVTFNGREIGTLAAYTLELRGPLDEVHTWPYTTGAPLLRALRETEENLTDLLPPGYSVRIKEWNE